MNELPHSHEIAALNRLQHWQDSAYLLPADLLGHLFNQLFSANVPVCKLQNWPACCMLLKFQLSMDAAGLRACCLQHLHEHYLFIAEQYKPGLEAELLWRFAYYISPLLLESAVSDGGKKPRAAQAGPRTGNKPLLISWQKIHN